MKLKTFFLISKVIVLVLLTNNMIVMAGTSGKITGIITDSQTGEPLPGVNVILEGTYIGAATDLDGRYLILNVPPGIYTLRASMIGYAEIRYENIQVKIDLTTAVDLELEETVLDVGETVVIVAERPLVQRDQTGSMTSIGAEDIAALPVQSVGDVLELQAGIVRDNNNNFHIRGGRSNEVAFWVDGVEVTDVYNGESMGTTIENNAIQELQVVSGTFNAEYGKAMSGIVNVITKEGGSKYSGRINIYGGDYVSNDNVYSVLTRIDTTINPETGEVLEKENSENPLDKLNLTFNTDFALSGPVPFLGDKVNFFINGRYVSREGYLYGRDWFTPQGYGGDSSLVSVQERYNYSGLAKITYRVLPNLKVNYQLMGDYSHTPHNYGYSTRFRNFRYTPDGLPHNYRNSMTHMLTMTHTLSSKTFYELRLATMSRESDEYVYKDPTKTPHWLARIASDPDLGIEEMVLDPSIPDEKTLLDSLKVLQASYTWFIDPNNSEGYVDQDSATAPITFSAYRAGAVNTLTFRDYSFWNAKLDFTSQINSIHQVKSGLEFKYHELKLDEYTLIAKKINDETIVPYTPEVPKVSSLSRDKYSYNPIEFSVYAQDKIELEQMIVNIGLRFDYFDANTTIPSDIRDPDIYRPFKDKNIYKNWVEPAGWDTLSTNEQDAYRAGFDEYTSEERKAFMRKDVDPKMNISPRLGIAYPITERGVIHFSYGHFFGMPGLQYLYNDSDYKLQQGGGNRLLGNPDLEPEKTVHYEIGLQQQLSDDIGMNVTLFYKDTRGWIGATPTIQTARTSVAYSKYRNEDYSNVYGLTLELKTRFSQSLSANVYYTYQLAEGTYSNPDDVYDNVYNATQPEEPRLALVPMNWDQRHTLNAFVAYQNNGWVVSITEKYQSGQPYTPTVSKSEVVGSSSYVGWTTNSQRIPSTNSMDIRILKAIKLASLNFQLYAQIYNLFDQRGQIRVYSETGTADYSANLKTDYPGYSPDRIGTYNSNLYRPEWYQPPREIQLGLIIAF